MTRNKSYRPLVYDKMIEGGSSQVDLMSQPRPEFQREVLDDKKRNVEGCVRFYSLVNGRVFQENFLLHPVSISFYFNIYITRKFLSCFLQFQDMLSANESHVTA